MAATEVRDNVDSYLLNIRQRIKQLEDRLGGSNLMEAHDVLKHTLHGEIERLRMESRALFLPEFASGLVPEPRCAISVIFVC